MATYQHDDTYTGERWAYGLTHRPPGYAHNPDGWIIGAIREASCPCVPFGIVEYPRPLTAREIDSYELIAMATHHCPERCARCEAEKDFGATCPGNDECIYGEDGGAAFACEGWAGMCCRCGASYAYGQMC